MDVYCHRLAKYIGSYTALMDGRLDAVIFTGGIGENAAMVRELSLGKLGVLGFDVDHESVTWLRVSASLASSTKKAPVRLSLSQLTKSWSSRKTHTA